MLNRIIVFAFRVSSTERQLIADLAVQLQRSQSDAVRFVVIEAARQLLMADESPIGDLKLHRYEVNREEIYHADQSSS